MENPIKDATEVIYDGCTAAASIAYVNCDTAFIYPITPSTLMAETADLWAFQGRKNIFDQVTCIRQMQSEAGAAGAVHGSLTVGCVTTTFTASQGLLLMVPNMYKIAGELTPCVFHVSARAIATQALSIFGDHSDVMAVRQCGWAILSSANVQESADMAQIAHMTTLKSRVPFVHFFDGFRISHELQKMKLIDNETIHKLLDHDKITEFRHRGLNPTDPHLIGTSQGPEVYFQNLEAANKYYEKVPGLVEESMVLFGRLTGRHHELFEYYGHPEATDVFVIMGAGSPVVKEVIDYYMKQDGEASRIGVVTVHLFRPWSLQHFLKALPQTTQRVAILDRTKESGALGEPLYLDVAASLQVAQRHGVLVLGGRFGLGSKDFTPAMCIAAVENLRSPPGQRKSPFTLGIEDDVTNLSLQYKRYRAISTVPNGTTQCMFWGLGSDGTVGANKNVIKIIGDNTPLFVQGYFAYSAHKAGGLTVSHLRFGPNPITSQYLIQQADYLACHRDAYVNQFKMLNYIKPGGVFVLNCSWSDEELCTLLPGHIQREIAAKDIQFYTIDANKVATETKMGRRINNILMTVFFKLSGVLPFEEAIQLFKRVIEKTYGKKGKHVVEANWKSVDAALDHCHRVAYDSNAWLKAVDLPIVERRKLEGAPEFVNAVLLPLERLEGDDLPVSALAPYAGGRLPHGTAGFEKRGIALTVPIVDMEKCTQCNYCSFVCPHAAIRPFLLDDDDAETAPDAFLMKKAKGAAELASFKYRIQVSPLDCTGCELCSIACPSDCLTMTPLDQVRQVEADNWSFGINLKSREELCEGTRTSLKGSQFYQPLMEFSGACEGCGETPYVKLLTQLFGERMIIANATGCSSIWGASYPSNPYTKNQKGYGPAWGNSLFEDNAEYGYGMVIALQQRRQRFQSTVKKFLMLPRLETIPSCIYESLEQYAEEWLNDAALCNRLHEVLAKPLEEHKSKHPLLTLINNEKAMIPKFSHWVIGGDGWAYDIGYGGLDHVIASGIDVNILVLDTEVYSNTGGQVSKATPMGAVHKFGASGHMHNKKDLGLIAMEYGHVYVASVASSANMTQTIRTFVEAEKYHGPSVIMAYAPCIEHGYIKPFSAQQVHCTMAVDSGYWPLYRYNPDLEKQGMPPLQLDSKKIKVDVNDMLARENRFEQLRRANPETARLLELEVAKWIKRRFAILKEKSEHVIGTGFGTKAIGGGDSNADATKIHVLYGSETGNAEDVAQRIGGLVKERTLACSVMQLSEVEVEELAEMTNVLIICSTAGQGELPGNAKELYEELSKPDLDPELLSKLNYAVFGLGDSGYIFFNEAAKKYDKRLEELGAKRVVSCGLGDDQADEGYESALGDWLPDVWTELKAPEPLAVSDDPPESMYVVTEITNGNSQLEYKQCVPYGANLVELCVNRRLTPSDYDVEVRHLEFNLSGSNMRYALGDSLAIYPQTAPSLVTDVCTYFNYDPDKKVVIKRSGTDASAKHEALFKYPMTVRQLLTECLDLGGKPNRRFYELLYKYCTNPEDKAKAKGLLADKALMQEYTKAEFVHCFDMLKKFSSITSEAMTLNRLIDLLPLHKPRYYSIASAQKFVGPDRLHLCIGTVDFTTAKKETRFGTCTGYLRTCAPDENRRFYVACALKATAFNMPPTDKNPIIMAGMGTGLAPFRAFIQQRAYLKQSGKEIGPVVLYFGCRYSKKDYLYGDELAAYEKEGVISDLKVAFSRDQKEKFYVQHHIDRDQPLLYKRLVTEQGYFYLCGSAKQVPIDIRAAVCSAISKEANVTVEEADQMVTDMQIKGQYNVEAW